MSRRRLLLGVAVSVLVGGAVFAYVLPRIAGYQSVWRVVAGLSFSWLLALIAVTVLNVVTFPLPWMVVLPGLGFLRGLQLTQASTAFGLVVPGGAPLGMAASFAMLHKAGFGRSEATIAVALAGLWNQLSTFLLPVVAVALLATEGFGSASLQLAALLGIGAAVAIAGAAAVLLWRVDFLERFAELSAGLVTRIRSALRKEPVEWSVESLLRNRSELVGLLRRRWHWLTLATIANQVTGYLMLETSIRAIGIGRAELSIAQTFAAWSLGRLLASLPITPGGIGIVELGLTGTLVGFGARHAPVVAAVLVYRALSVLPTLALGLLAILTWRRRVTPE
jgi:uncharacterized membrane protein YbhN (UPF0104 family)